MEDINTQESQSRALIAEYVKTHCRGYYEDTCSKTYRCYLTGDNDCIAINSQYSIIEGKCPCLEFQKLQKYVPLKLPIPRLSTGRTCGQCGKPLKPKGNRQLFCGQCSEARIKEQARVRKARQRQKATAQVSGNGMYADPYQRLYKARDQALMTSAKNPSAFSHSRSNA